MTTLSSSLLAPVVSTFGANELFELGDHRGRVLLSSEQTGDFLLVETEADFLGGVPPHVHTLEDETFIVQEGRFEIIVGDERLEVGPDQVAFAPRGVPHTWHCLSEAGGRFLLLVSPGRSFETFITEVARHGITPASASPAQIADLCEIAESHGITMLPPA